jgi:hypothetical protein
LDEALQLGKKDYVTIEIGVRKHGKNKYNELSHEELILDKKAGEKNPNALLNPYQNSGSLSFCLSLMPNLENCGFHLHTSDIFRQRTEILCLVPLACVQMTLTPCVHNGKTYHLKSKSSRKKTAKVFQHI